MKGAAQAMRTCARHPDTRSAATVLTCAYVAERAILEDMDAPSAPPLSKRMNGAGAALLAGWALYITVVTASNLTDLFWSFHWENWAFRSGNLAYIATATRIYFRTEQANQALLALVIAWEGAAAALVWLAALRWARGSRAALACARRGLVTLGLLWFGFAISAEIFVAYDRGVNESAYWILATAVLVTVAVLEMWAPLRADIGYLFSPAREDPSGDR